MNSSRARAQLGARAGLPCGPKQDAGALGFHAPALQDPGVSQHLTEQSWGPLPVQDPALGAGQLMPGLFQSIWYLRRLLEHVLGIWGHLLKE